MWEGRHARISEHSIDFGVRARTCCLSDPFDYLFFLTLRTLQIAAPVVYSGKYCSGWEFQTFHFIMNARFSHMISVLDICSNTNAVYESFSYIYIATGARIGIYINIRSYTYIDIDLD